MSEILIVFFFALSYARAGPGPGGSRPASEGWEPLSRWSRQWLDEVVPYIITGAEKDVFISLPTEEERGSSSRPSGKEGPDQRTAANEFKLEYYRRIALVNKYVGAAGMDGWRTDRGKICILLGPPDEIQREISPAGSSLAIFRGPEETWSYWGLSDPGLPYNMEFTFTDRTGTGHYVLDRGLDLAGQDGTPLDLDSLHHYFDYQEFLARAARNPFEGLPEPRGIVTTEVSSERPALEAEETGRKVAEGLSGGTPVGGGQLDLGDIALASGTGGSAPAAARSGGGVSTGLSAAMPMPVMEPGFQAGEELEATFEIHSLSLDPRTGLNAFQVEYSFYQDDAMVASPPASRTEATADRDCRVRTSLRLKNFKPGRYRLRATVRDLMSGKTASREAVFVVTP